MSPGRGGSEQHAPRAIVETLDSVVAPAVRDALLRAALDESAEAELPRDPERLRQFAQGPLRRALVQGLGAELAETLTEEIARLLEVVASSSGTPRRSSRSSGKLRAVSTPPRRTQPPPRSLTPPATLPRRSQGPRVATLRSLGREPTPPPWSGQVSRRAPEPTDDAPDLEVSATSAEDLDFEDLPGLSQDAPPIDDPLAEADGARSLADLFPPVSPRNPSLPRGTMPSPRKLTLGSGPSSSERTPSSRNPEDVKTPPWASDKYPSALAEMMGMNGAVPSSRAGRERALPHVLVATRDPAMLRKLSVWLDPRAAVMRVRSVIDMLHRLEDAARTRCVLVLDCRQPSVRPLSLAALAEELPVSTQVVLVGATAELVQKLSDITSVAASWVVLGASANPREIADRCVEIVS